MIRLPFDLVTVDFETNGGSAEAPSDHRIIEIGAIRVDADLRIVDEYSARVDGRPINPKVIKIHGIEDSHLEGVPKFAEVHSEFDSWCGKRQEYLLGAWGAYFDIPVLRAEYVRLGIDYPHRGESLDIKAIVWWDLLKQGRPAKRLGLSQAAGLYGMPFYGKQHKAVDDARMTVRLLQAVAGKRHPPLVTG